MLIIFCSSRAFLIMFHRVPRRQNSITMANFAFLWGVGPRKRDAQVGYKGVVASKCCSLIE